MLFVLLIASNINTIKQITGHTTLEQEPEKKLQDFSTYTKAVCEKNGEGIYCEDKLFVKCGEIEQIVDVPNGSAVFSSEWEDPRCQ